MDSSVKSWLLIAVATVVWAGPARSAKIFTVGDSTGWTILNSPNYTQWASGKVFHVGDALEVKEPDFRACKNSSAIKEYDNGDDSITIRSAGHSYFICGFPGHCQGGQKVDILAVDSSDAPSSSPSDSSPPPPNAGNLLPARASVFIGGLIMVLLFC